MSTQTVSVTEGNPVHDEHPTHDIEKPTPLPKFQIFIIILIQFAEPITALVIYPFVNQFVRETGITKGDERKTGYYAGIIVRWSSSTQELYSPTYYLLRNPLFFSQRLLLSFNGAIYQTGLDVDLYYFWLRLVWRLQCLFSVLRRHLFPLFFRDVFRECSTATSVCIPAYFCAFPSLSIANSRSVKEHDR